MTISTLAILALIKIMMRPRPRASAGDPDEEGGNEREARRVFGIVAEKKQEPRLREHGRALNELLGCRAVASKVPACRDRMPARALALGQHAFLFEAADDGKKPVRLRPMESRRALHTR
jgi:hypothetical protein